LSLLQVGYRRKK